jgi:hypothetical protein
MSEDRQIVRSKRILLGPGALTTIVVSVMLVTKVAAADQVSVRADDVQSMCQAKLYPQEQLPRTAEEIVIFKAGTACTYYVAGLANLILHAGVASSLHACLPKGITMDELRNY